MLSLTVNGHEHRLAGDPQTPLLWVLRETLGLRGTKYGCGTGACGICTIHLDGAAARACVTTLGEATGKAVTTIEGLRGAAADRLRGSWVAEGVPQCGYCQPGMIMASAALVQRRRRPSDAEIDAALGGVLCRCGTYQRVRKAIDRACRGAAPTAAPSASPPDKGSSEAVFRPNPWVRIAADGTITVLIDRSEMGQGVTTSLATLLAEELEVDLDQIRIEFAPAEPAYYNDELGTQMTAGSTSVRAGWLPLRRAGAAARAMLVAAAAATWQADPSDCRAERGSVVHTPSGRRLGYGALAARAAELPVPEDVPLKPPSRYRLIGRSLPRLDARAHVEGRTRFGSDVALPGQLVAVVRRPPSFGGTLASFDDRRARAVPGVRDVFAIGSGVAVVAESTWAALRGRDALEVSWKGGPNAALDSAHIRESLTRALHRAGRVVHDEGDVERSFKAARHIVEATYQTPYLAHATMEPMNATAQVGPEGCDVWAPTQAQTEAQEAAVRAAGLPPDRVRIHTTYLGGGFGRRLEQDFIVEAVEIARRMPGPVQLFWTREDDLRHDFYRPAHSVLLRAALDDRGRPRAWLQRVAGPPLALDGIDVPYAIANRREEHITVDPGVPTGPWRSVGASQNAFAIECFIDELAAAAQADPVAFRLGLLAKAPRHQAVLKLAAEKAGWGTPLSGGRHRGVALYHSFASWVAQVAEVSVGTGGEVTVHRVVCAIDCGTVVNPDIVCAQMEGAVAFGLTAALKGEITIADGGVREASFGDYPLLTLPEMPEVEVYIVPSGEPPGGVGEPGVPPIAPAVANAVFGATGRRVRQLPIRVSGSA
jgi:isoquinoline 1-oxidoreductase beta subunit